ncbi:GREB1-like protein isoform X2 [Oopsacas minuta]|uniref:GREB1-like protein isoform X2 n=1 Tax=Oopsacas minuta TaxID=111878 RepID=A0AAV7KEF1_9METZ|nr:GREB1-like protein isoform X2 [Oopsacas minuta]
MANISPNISPSSIISSPSISRANTPRIYKKRPLEYCDDKALKRRKHVLTASLFKPPIPNVIVLPQDQTQTTQFELQSQNNKISSTYPFPFIVQAPMKRDTIMQQPNIPTELAQILPQSNSTLKSDPPNFHLLKHINPLVLVCVGDLIDSPTHFLEKDIKKSLLFKDVCDSMLPNANRSWKVCLSPESLVLFIINYLTSVSNGGIVMKELLETMLVYAKMGEHDWMQVYYQFNNSIWKMQVSHLARLAAYQSNSNVMIMQSAISLVNGVNNALCSLSELKKFPDFIVVLYNNSIQTNKPLEFCVIVLNKYISKTIQEQDVQVSKDKINLNFTKSVDEDQIRKLLYKRSQLLRDRALPPFRATSFSTYCTAAMLERVLPQTSSIVEYQPKGPFKQQEIAALTLLKKVKGLRNSVTDTSFISNFTSVDFYIFVPTTPTLYWQTIERLSESNLIKDAIRAQLNDERIPSIALAESHVIKLDLSQVVNPELIALINTVQTRTNTLFICVQDNAHRFTTLSNGSMQPNNSSVVVSNPCLAYMNLLHMPNVLSLAVTSSPLSLLNSQSSIPPENEVNWRETEINPCHLTYPQGAHYQDIESILEEDTDVKLFEDTVFEDKVEQLCQHSKYEDSTFDIIRARLLAQEYTTALLKLTGQAKNLTCSGETFSMLHDLISQPMNNNYGYGPMIALRVHSTDVGKFVYDQLVNARKDVGLQYRFEIILDDGSQDLSIDPYFVQRMRTWKFGKHANDKGAYQYSYFSALKLHQTTWQPKTYLQLNNLPCILIVAGDERGGETLPKSVSHYDLRLVSGISVTSHSLNLDLGYIHHYVDSQKTPKKDRANTQCMSQSGILPKSLLQNSIFVQESNPDESLDCVTNGLGGNNNEDFRMNTEDPPEQIGDSNEDSLPMISISPAKSPLSQISNTSSHSSNKKFSIEHLTSNIEPTVTSHLMETEEAISTDIADGPSSGRNSVISSFSDPEINQHPQEFQSTQTEPVQAARSTIWKTPAQGMDYTSVGVSKPQISNSMPHTIKYKPNAIQQSSRLLKPHPLSSLHNISMSSLNSREEIITEADDFDDEDEDDAIGVPDYYNTLTCLLSRPYKNILTSKFATLNIRNILPPSRNLIFEENLDRQPQNNTSDYGKLSKYYRQWASPCTNHIDLIRASLSSKFQIGKLQPISTRFLLTGPPQVGKTGAYILFIKLLQDLVHSSNFVKIYDKFECENSTSNPRSPASTNTSNFSLPKSMDILKSKFDSNPINLYQHERLSKLIYIEGESPKRSFPAQTFVSHTQGASPELNSEYRVTNASSVIIKEEIQSPVHEDETYISTHNFNELPTPKFDHSTPMKEDCFSVIQQLPDLAYAYDKSHSCPHCVEYYGRLNNLAIELTYKMNNGQGPQLKFYIPQQHIVNFQYTANKTLVRMNLAFYERENPMKPENFICRTPIFTPSTGRAKSGLFNLAHVMKHQKHIHIIVVNENEVFEYRKKWPTHIIMAVPNLPEFYSLGGVMEFIKQFSTENYNAHERVVLNQNYIIWPYILILSDSCLMFKSTPAQLEPPNTSQNNCITLFDILKFIEVDPEFIKYGAMSVRQWTSKSVPEENFTKSFLNTSFLYLHVAMLKDVHFDPLSHTFIAADVTLKLLAFGIPFCRINNFSYIKKFIKNGGESFHDSTYNKVRYNLLCNPEKFIGTPDCDQASSITVSGSYIMEAYLQKAASKIFPLANSRDHPVLQVNKFMNFSDNTFVSFVHEKTHSNHGQHKDTKYGGLLIFSSEMLEDSKFLKNFQFVHGATICLVVTKNRLNLRKEITRLNLEDSWRFKLSNESFTLCALECQPLYFYTGRYDVLQESN